MHPAFKSIEFGPFAGTYHREAVGGEFKEALSAFLEAELLPQIEQAYESTSGRLTASYDDQKYCGPHSAVRDIYKLEFTFHRPSGDDTIKVEVVFTPSNRAFGTRNHRSLYLWTTPRRQRFQHEQQAIQDLCRQIDKHQQVAAVCPLCSAPRRVADSPGLFDVRCPERCFTYNYHRDPTTGAFLHGHFCQKEPSR